MRITVIDAQNRNIVKEYNDVVGLENALKGGRLHYMLKLISGEKRYVPAENNDIAIDGNYCSCFKVAGTA